MSRELTAPSERLTAAAQLGYNHSLNNAYVEANDRQGEQI